MTAYYFPSQSQTFNSAAFLNRVQKCRFYSYGKCLKGGVGKFEKSARDTLCVILHGMLLTS